MITAILTGVLAGTAVVGLITGAALLYNWWLYR